MAIPLIDKQDSFEIVRDQIAAVLRTEIDNQKALAVGAGKDPNDFDVHIYVERNWPEEKWLNDTGYTGDTVPVCTVWVEQTVSHPSESPNSALEQVFGVTYNLDIMAHGQSSDNVAGGQFPGDRTARLRCHSAVKMIRNILQSGLYYQRLGLPVNPKIIWPNTQFENLEFGQTEIGGTEANFSVWNCTARFRVRMSEFSPEEPALGNIALVHVDITHSGEVVALDIP